MITMHTPAQAAKIAGVSRSKVSRALKDGKLHGRRNNEGNWKISDDDLKAWMSAQLNTVQSGVQDRSGAQALRVEVNSLKERLEDMRAQKDDWKARAEAADARAEAAQLRAEEYAARRWYHVFFKR